MAEELLFRFRFLSNGSITASEQVSAESGSMPSGRLNLPPFPTSGPQAPRLLERLSLYFERGRRKTHRMENSLKKFLLRYCLHVLKGTNIKCTARCTFIRVHIHGVISPDQYMEHYPAHQPAPSCPIKISAPQRGNRFSDFAHMKKSWLLLTFI